MSVESLEHQNQIRNDWTLEEVSSVYNSSLMSLINKAAIIHQEYHQPNEVQVCTLLSIKTGGCPEDCEYCPQAARYATDIEVHRLMTKEEVMPKAMAAKEAGSSRFCMGAAWREIRDNKDFEKVLDIIKEVNGLGLEVCCTLGMLTYDQAVKMKEAGLHAYNHNLDTSEEHYSQIITTRTYEDRLNTLEAVRNAGISVCSGGIIGLGEKEEDRIHMLHTLASLPKHPESVPVNALVPVKGTPLENQEKVSIWEMLRMIATARVLMPKSMIRLSAGRVSMNMEEQALCFLAGANSIFAGDQLLTTPNNELDFDQNMFDVLGIKPLKPNLNKKKVDVTEYAYSETT